MSPEPDIHSRLAPEKELGSAVSEASKLTMSSFCAAHSCASSVVIGEPRYPVT